MYIYMNYNMKVPFYACEDGIYLLINYNGSPFAIMNVGSNVRNYMMGSALKFIYGNWSPSFENVELMHLYTNYNVGAFRIHGIGSNFRN